MTDINVFVRPSRRNAEREAVGLARMRQQVKAGKPKVAWMSEEDDPAAAFHALGRWADARPFGSDMAPRMRNPRLKQSFHYKNLPLLLRRN